MTCGGCAGAVTKIINKFETVENVDADVAAKVNIQTHSITHSTT